VSTVVWAGEEADHEYLVPALLWRVWSPRDRRRAECIRTMNGLDGLRYEFTKDEGKGWDRWDESRSILEQQCHISCSGEGS